MPLICRRFNCDNGMISLVVYLLMVSGTLVFGLAGYQTLIDFSALASGSAVLMGFGYGWSLVTILVNLYRFDDLWQIAIVVVVSSVVSTLCLGLIHLYSNTQIQVGGSVLAVLVMAGGNIMTQLELSKLGSSKKESSLDQGSKNKLRLTGNGFLGLNKEQGYYLVQLIVVCIIVIALRSVNPGGLWGDHRSISIIDDISGLFPTVFTAAIFIVLGLLVFRFHTFSARNERLQLPYLVLIASLLALNFLKEDFGSTSIFLIFSSVTERICLAIFSFTMVSSARKLPFPPVSVLGVAVAFNHLIALVWMLFFEDLGLVSGLVLSSVCYLLVLVIAFLGHDGLRWGSSPQALDSENIYESLQQRCLELAKMSQLTKRETDVLLLLAQGRSIPYIQNELVLSEGTVKTHVKHIYEKLSIHSKQDLLSLVENKG